MSRSGGGCGASTQATSCDCNSCRLAPRLDLKVFVHHGSYVRRPDRRPRRARGLGRDRRPSPPEGRDGRRLAGQRLRPPDQRRGRCPPSRSRPPGTLAGGGDDRAPRARVHVRPGPRGALAGGEQHPPPGRRLGRRRAPGRDRHGRRGRSCHRLGAPDVARPAGDVGGPDRVRGGARGRPARGRVARPSASRAGSRPSRRSWTGSPGTTWPGDSWSRASDRSRPPPTSRSSGRAPASGSDGRPSPKQRSNRPMPGGSGRTRRRRRVASRASRRARCRSPAGSPRDA